MKSSLHRLHRVSVAIVAVALTLAFATAASADKDFTGQHPIRVLKARTQSDLRGGASASARGNLTIWLQNPTSVTVDGIDIEVELYNDNKRKVDTIKRSIDPLDPGEKRVITFRWDVVAEEYVSPRFFIAYNVRGTQKERFEGDSPTGR